MASATETTNALPAEPTAPVTATETAPTATIASSEAPATAPATETAPAAPAPAPAAADTTTATTANTTATAAADPPAAATAVETTPAAAVASSVAPPSNPLRNQELAVAELPDHPVLSRSSAAPPLQAFLKAVLVPALELVDVTWPKQWTGGSEKTAKPSNSKVKLYRWEDNKADQTWFIRKSTHANVADPGTFSYDELDKTLRIDHTKNEAAYTPDIYHDVEICKWGSEQGLVPGLVDGFSDIQMNLVETAHKFPSPLIPRAFAELVISAKTGSNGLIVVQIPVDLRKLPQSFFSNSKNEQDGSSLQKKKVVIMGSYVSIERARTTEKGVIEWTMGTVSDAKGALPRWIQRSQIGGAIAKDVSYVTQYIIANRAAKQ